MKISFVGSGNVATQFGIKLFQSGHQIHQIYSTTYHHAAALASKVEATALNDYSAFDSNIDLLIIAVRDDSIAAVAEQIALVVNNEKVLVVHTSGGTSTAALSTHFKNYGVLYPYQTMKQDIELEWEDIPICICCNEKNELAKLKQVALNLSPKVYEIDDEQRAYLHVCGVFVNNFVNHLFYLGATLAKQHELPFDLLRPLIQTTFRKIEEHTPDQIQTGPAIRKDLKTIEKHLRLLKDQPEIAKIYKALTDSIQEVQLESNKNDFKKQQ